jgi:hypothetical protein
LHVVCDPGGGAGVVVDGVVSGAVLDVTGALSGGALDCGADDVGVVATVVGVVTGR